MLGQICQPQFYRNPDSSYQEVFFFLTFLIQAFVLHAHHDDTKFSLFYARFPNEYLMDIVNEGPYYLTSGSKSLQNPVKLYQSRCFRMADFKEQANFFILLAELLNYLRSGESHVGYFAKEFDKSHEVIGPECPCTPTSIICNHKVDILAETQMDELTDSRKLDEGENGRGSNSHLS
jgi:hypothetical protein